MLFFGLEVLSLVELVLIFGVENIGFFSFGIGLLGKLKLVLFGFMVFDFESKLEILVNFEVFFNVGFDSLEEIFVLGLNFFGKKWFIIFKVE